MKVKGYMGSVELVDQRLTIHKQATGTTIVSVGDVQSVSIISAGIGMAAIRFTLTGEVAQSRQPAFGSHARLALDPLTVTFRKGRRHEFAAFVAAIHDTRRSD